LMFPLSMRDDVSFVAAILPAVNTGFKINIPTIAWSVKPLV